MTKAEASQRLNSILEAAAALRHGCQDVPRVEARLEAITDQVMLLALDLKLPLKPVPDDIL